MVVDHGMFDPLVTADTALLAMKGVDLLPNRPAVTR